MSLGLHWSGYEQRGPGGEELTNEKVKCCRTKIFQGLVKLHGLAALLTLHGAY
jgi:hypothetical protein